MVARSLRDYPQRAVLGLMLMSAQAFFYNAIFFSYALVLTRFYGVPSQAIGWYILPFALGNFLGPLAARTSIRHDRPQADDRAHLCHFGRAAGDRRLAVPRGCLGAAQLTLCWSVIFFFASAAASSAYLTVSESFPLEARALAIALFLCARHRDRRSRPRRGCSAC